MTSDPEKEARRAEARRKLEARKLQRLSAIHEEEDRLRDAEEDAKAFASIIESEDFYEPDDVAGEHDEPEHPPRVERARPAAADSSGSLVEALASRLLTTAALQALPPPEWLIDGLVPLDALTLLYGPSGGGKSFVAIDWALHVATSSWWNSREVRGGSVLYVVAESPRGVGPRAQAWQTHHAVADIEAHHGVMWLPEPVNLFDLSAAGVFREVVETLRPVLIVVDTLARCAIGADENSAKDMGVLVEQLDKLRRATGAAIVIVHHTGKSLESGARGSSALRAAVDAELEVTGSDGQVTVKTTKQKNAPEALPVHLKLTPVAESVVLLPARGGVSELPAGAHETLAALVAIDVPGGVPSSAWKASVDVAERTFYRHRAGLLADGLVVNLGTDNSPRYRPASALENPD